MVKVTEQRIGQLPVDELDQKVKGRMLELRAKEEEEEEFEATGSLKKKELDKQFSSGIHVSANLQFCFWLPTPRLRGLASARAERVAHLALKQRSPAEAALTVHKAMDVPKHYTAASLVAALEDVGKEAEITRKVPRSTNKKVVFFRDRCRASGIHPRGRRGTSKFEVLLEVMFVAGAVLDELGRRVHPGLTREHDFETKVRERVNLADVLTGSKVSFVKPSSF